MTSTILPMLSTRSPRLVMMVADETMEPLMRFRPSVVFCIVSMPLVTSSRERPEMSSRTLALSATR